MHVRPVLHPVYGANVDWYVDFHFKVGAVMRRSSLYDGDSHKANTFYGYDPRWLSWVKYVFIENANIGLILRLVDISWKY